MISDDDVEYCAKRAGLWPTYGDAVPSIETMHSGVHDLAGYIVETIINNIAMAQSRTQSAQPELSVSEALVDGAEEYPI